MNTKGTPPGKRTDDKKLYPEQATKVLSPMYSNKNAP
jgi:hypothetical protein